MWKNLHVRASTRQQQCSTTNNCGYQSCRRLNDSELVARWQAALARNNPASFPQAVVECSCGVRRALTRRRMNHWPVPVYGCLQPSSDLRHQGARSVERPHGSAIKLCGTADAARLDLI